MQLITKARLAILSLVALTLLACAPPGGPSGTAPGASAPSGGQQAAQPQQSRTMIVMTRVEPRSLLSKGILTGVFADGPNARRLFNASLFIDDERDVPRPYLVEEAPKLDTDSWKLFPDGRMETTYRLRPNLTWHDGAALTANDFVFALKVFTDPALAGNFTPTPQNLMDEALAPDPRTLVIKWRRTSPDADSLALNRFGPLPRHILETLYERDSADAFSSSPYWTREFIGAGPYKVDRWEAGAAIEGSAFDGHALGRPRIDRIRVLFVSDANTAVANLLAGGAHVTMDDVIRFQQGETLKGEWAANKGGDVVLSPSQTRYVQVQWRQQYVNPISIHDKRVREAIVRSIDRKELSDALLSGEGIVANMMVSPLRENFAEIDRVVTKYAYDLTRAEQLMADAGFTKRDGFYANAAGDRFSPELRAIAGGTDEQELSAVTNLLSRAGINVQPLTIAPAQATDGQYVATFPSFSTANTGTSGDTPLVKLWTGRAPSPENRWTGSALGGWSNPEYDRLYDAYSTTLNRADRNNVVLQMMKLVSDELPVLPLYYIFQVEARLSSLTGPGSAGTSGSWNIHEWELK